MDVSGTVTCVALRQGAEPPESEVEAPEVEAPEVERRRWRKKIPADPGEMGSSPGKNGNLMGFDVFLGNFGWENSEF